MYDWIKQYYDMKLYTTGDIEVFVKASWITAEQFKSITGQDYAAQ